VLGDEDCRMRVCVPCAEVATSAQQAHRVC
jgi:hypothetical protein